MTEIKHFKDLSTGAVPTSDIQRNMIKMVSINLLILYPLNLLLLALWRYLEFYLPKGFSILTEDTITFTIQGNTISFPEIPAILLIAHLLQMIAFLYYMAPINKLFSHPESRSVFEGSHLTFGFHTLFWLPLIVFLGLYNHEIPSSQLVPHFSSNQLFLFQNIFMASFWYMSTKIFEISNTMVFRYFHSRRFCTREISTIYHNQTMSSVLLFGVMMIILTLHIHPFLRFYAQNNYYPYDLMTHLPKIISAIVVMVGYAYYMTWSFETLEQDYMQSFEGYLQQMGTAEYADFTYNIPDHADQVTRYFNRYINKINDSWGSTYQMSRSFDDSLDRIKTASLTIKELPKFDQSSDAFNSLNALSSYISKVIDTFESSNTKLHEDFKDIMQLPENIYHTIQIAYDIKSQSLSCLNSAKSIMDKIENSVTKSQSVTDSMHRISANVKNAGTEAQFIDEILMLLQDIAEQTNILSINAALEAAHAGNSGKGFAIVSNEVRALATASSNAVDEISQKLISIQQFIEIAVEKVMILEKATDENHLLVKEASDIMKNVVQNFQNIELVVAKTCGSADIQGKMTEQTFTHINSFLEFLDTYQILLTKQHQDIESLKEKTSLISRFEKETSDNIQILMTDIRELESLKNQVTIDLNNITQKKSSTLLTETSLGSLDNIPSADKILEELTGVSVTTESKEVEIELKPPTFKNTAIISNGFQVYESVKTNVSDESPVFNIQETKITKPELEELTKYEESASIPIDSVEETEILTEEESADTYQEEVSIVDSEEVVESTNEEIESTPQNTEDIK
ncbi:MAG: methyl-accepting chemotaxis protein [Brevinema sp.]